ncbi:unnamed protein product [Leptidea sinapis]|uniref:Spaetzle domain-containing protein n=1 Tax=Leptidea sinapis TaxID=189913 RepID=A0A5E4PUM5_9NEOP|nr:unnamed protein product [Leptidea sinapis]
MRRMYGEERHISVLKAELENFIEDDDENEKPVDFAEDIIKTKIMYTKKNHGRGIKDKPHFRPIQNNDRQKNNDSLKVKPLESSANKTRNDENNDTNKTDMTNETLNDENGISYKTRLESIANIEINNIDPDVITLEAVIKQSIETNSIYPKNAGNSRTEALKEDIINSTESTLTENVVNTTETDALYDDITTENKEEWKNNADISTLPPTLLFSEHEKLKVDRIDPVVNEKKEEFRPKPQYQETVKPAVIKLRGANACESKEEMAAPFWANSTRGEVLALLNMYPFEQYIHLETCVHERKQMYCREGCRLFPGCCVCKCYDVPLEFRARSPRILHPQYDDDVKRIIYEDVARDWYSSSYDDFDDDLY